MGGRDRIPLSWLVLATAAAVAACSWRPTVPAVPSQGGHPWVELTTEHFMVWTDASAAQGRALAEDMEHLRQVLYGVAFFHPTSVSRCFVIALRNTGEMHAFVDWLHGAETWPVSPIMQPVIVLPIDDVDDEKGTVTHELTHAISYSAIPNQPRWFSEGLATYFETVRLHQHGGSLEVGRPNTLLLRVIWAQHLLPIDSLFACTRLSCTDVRWYATAWALFAYLLSERPKQLQAYMQELAAGERASDPATWTAAFGKLTPADLDSAVADWVANGDLTVTTYRAQLRDLPIAQRSLGDADVYAARALLRFLLAPNGPIPKDVAHALAVDPTNVVARMILEARGVSTPLAVARRIVAAHPDDWRAWWIDAHAEPGGPTARSARAAMCALVARNPANLPPGICVVAPPAPDDRASHDRTSTP